MSTDRALSIAVRPAARVLSPHTTAETLRAVAAHLRAEADALAAILPAGSIPFAPVGEDAA